MAKFKLSTALKVGKQAAEIGSTVHAIRGTDKKQMARGAGKLAFSQGASHGKEAGKSYLKTFEVIPRLVLRGIQLVLALIICGFYGNRISSESKEGGHGIGIVWIYGVAIAGLSAATAIFFTAAASAGSIPLVGSRLKLLKTYRAYPWDATLFVAWIVMFGVFAGLFLKREDGDPYRGSSTRAMRIAVWFDIANAIMWLLSAGYGGFKTFAARKADRLTDKAGQKMFGGNEAVV